MVKLVGVIRNFRVNIKHVQAAANAPVLPLLPPRCHCTFKCAAATTKIALLPSCQLRRQAGCCCRTAVLNNGEHTLIPVMAKMIHSPVWDSKSFLLKDSQPLHMVKLVGAVRNFRVNIKYVRAAVNAPLLPPPPPRCHRTSKPAAATTKITLLPSCCLRRQAGRRHRAAAATATSAAVLPPLRYHCLQNKKIYNTID